MASYHRFELHCNTISVDSLCGNVVALRGIGQFWNTPSALESRAHVAFYGAFTRAWGLDHECYLYIVSIVVPFSGLIIQF